MLVYVYTKTYDPVSVLDSGLDPSTTGILIEIEDFTAPVQKWRCATINPECPTLEACGEEDVTRVLISATSLYDMAFELKDDDLATLVAKKFWSLEAFLGRCDLGAVLTTAFELLEPGNRTMRMELVKRCVLNHQLILSQQPEVVKILEEHEPALWVVGIELATQQAQDQCDAEDTLPAKNRSDESDAPKPQLAVFQEQEKSIQDAIQEMRPIAGCSETRNQENVNNAQSTPQVNALRNDLEQLRVKYAEALKEYAWAQAELAALKAKAVQPTSIGVDSSAHQDLSQQIKQLEAALQQSKANTQKISRAKGWEIGRLKQALQSKAVVHVGAQVNGRHESSPCCEDSSVQAELRAVKLAFEQSKEASEKMQKAKDHQIAQLFSRLRSNTTTINNLRRDLNDVAHEWSDLPWKCTEKSCRKSMVGSYLDVKDRDAKTGRVKMVCRNCKTHYVSDR